MPRPNPARSIEAESVLARRIAHERERLGLSYEGLAKLMTDLGCPMRGSAIFRIETGDPPRRITVNEYAALVQVFGLKMTTLVDPLESQLAVNNEPAAESEHNLARRVHQERLRHGWSQETLAKLMTDAGVKMHQSSIAKIERTEPPRRPITVDESLAFSRVFSVALPDLLISPEAADNVRVRWIEERMDVLIRRQSEEIGQIEALRREHAALTQSGSHIGPSPK